jgi:hypothetical protein
MQTWSLLTRCCLDIARCIAGEVGRHFLRFILFCLNQLLALLYSSLIQSYCLFYGFGVMDVERKVTIEREREFVVNAEFGRVG